MEISLDMQTAFPLSNCVNRLIQTASGKIPVSVECQISNQCTVFGNQSVSCAVHIAALFGALMLVNNGLSHTNIPSGVLREHYERNTTRSPNVVEGDVTILESKLFSDWNLNSIRNSIIDEPCVEHDSNGIYDDSLFLSIKAGVVFKFRNQVSVESDRCLNVSFALELKGTSRNDIIDS